MHNIKWEDFFTVIIIKYLFEVPTSQESRRDEGMWIGKVCLLRKLGSCQIAEAQEVLEIQTVFCFPHSSNNYT